MHCGTLKRIFAFPAASRGQVLLDPLLHCSAVSRVVAKGPGLLQQNLDGSATALIRKSFMTRTVPEE